MVIRIFYRIITGFITNEKIIERLADSYPIRRAAQMTSYLIHRSRQSIEQAKDDLSQNTKINGVSPARFTRSFIREFKQDWSDATRFLIGKPFKSRKRW